MLIVCSLCVYEVLPDPLAYSGEFPFPRSVVDGGADVIEQPIDGELLTPVRTLAVNAVFLHDQDLHRQGNDRDLFSRTQYGLDAGQLRARWLFALFAVLFCLYTVRAFFGRRSRNGEVSRWKN